MIFRTENIVSKSLVCFLSVALATLGCLDNKDESSQKQEDAKSVSKDLSNEPTGREKERVVIDNANHGGQTSDLQRLQNLTERLNLAKGSNYRVVFGLPNGSENTEIAVDYALFDRLSDDTVAVMIAEEIATREIIPSFQPQSVPNPTTGQILQRRDILRADEMVGRHLAAAGFGADGFRDWLENRNFLATAPAIPVSANLRVEAFLKGFEAPGNQVGAK